MAKKEHTQTPPGALVPKGTILGRMPPEGGRGKIGQMLTATTTLCSDVAHTMSALGMGSEHNILQGIATLATSLSSQNTKELVAQATLSIDQDIETFLADNQHRAPFSQRTFLASAEVAMSHRDLSEQIEFMRRLTDHLVTRMKQYPNNNDVRQYLMATLMHEATNGAMMTHLRQGQDAGKVKKERGEEVVLQHINGRFQEHAGSLVVAFADYVSTPAGNVYGVPKTERQMELANGYLYANRDIVLARMFTDPDIGAAEVEQAMQRGTEFLQNIREKQPLWFHRQSWLAAVRTANPAVFHQMMMLVDPSRAYNRGVVKPDTYHPGRKKNIPKDAGALEAYAYTHDFDDATERMVPAALNVPSSHEVPAGQKAMPSQNIGPLMERGIFVGRDVVATMGDLYRLNDKWGPYSEVSHSGAPSLMIGKDAFVGLARASFAGAVRVLHHAVWKVNPNEEERKTMYWVHDEEAEKKLGHDSQALAKLMEGLTNAGSVAAWQTALNKFPGASDLQTDEGRQLLATMQGKDLDGMYDALVTSQRMFLTDTMREIERRVGTMGDAEAQFTATQLAFLGLSLREGMYADAEAVRPLQRELTRLVTHVIMGRRRVSPQARMACEFVLSTCMPFFPDELQKEALDMLKIAYEKDETILGQGGFQRLTLPLAVNTDIYLDASKDEKHGVRAATATSVVEMATELIRRYPGMHEGPTYLAAVLLSNPNLFANIPGADTSDADLPTQLFRTVYRIGARLRLNGASLSNTAIEGFQREVVSIVTQELYDKIYRESPLVYLSQMQQVYGAAEGLVAGTEAQNERLLQVFARTAGMYAQDVLVTHSNGTVTMVQLPMGVKANKTVLSETEAMALIPQGMTERAQTEYSSVAAEVRGEESTQKVIEEILRIATVDGLVRDDAVLAGVGDMMTALFRPEIPVTSDAPAQGVSRKSAAERKAAQVNVFFRDYSHMTRYDRTLGLVALLATIDSSKAHSAEAVSNIVGRLLDEEAAERSSAVGLFHETGMVDSAAAREQLVQTLRQNILTQLTDAQDARATANQLRRNVRQLQTAKLEELARLESDLAGLHLEQDAQALDVMRQQIAMRRMQITSDSAYVQAQLPQIIGQVSQQRQDIMQEMRGLSQEVFRERLEIIKWFRSIYNKQGPVTQVKVQLQKKLHQMTGIFMPIALPDVQQLCAMVGLKLDGSLEGEPAKQLSLDTN